MLVLASKSNPATTYSPAFLATGKLSGSKNPADVTFIGKPKPTPDQHHPLNEPEVKNLIWLLDHRPVTFSVDLHSALLKIMHPWGIERSGSNSAQTFQKTAFDGKGDGTLGDTYSEFFPNTSPARLLGKHDQIAKSMQGKIAAATGRTYGVGGIAAAVYPATGSFTDFVFSRQFTIPNSPPQHAFAAVARWHPGLLPRRWSAPRLRSCSPAMRPSSTREWWWGPP
ncbi:M14 family zinc carboxypeptidase [Nocardia sp. NPDC050630]|uniref:M14 family zinc carboxypeptidase n=1 Tax=Nocardia sp. NPDC050630 TaxID=3364321 RepID=UPI003796CED8